MALTSRIGPSLARWLVLSSIVLAAWLTAMLPRFAAPMREGLEAGDQFFYDSFYRLRPIRSQANGDVVIVAVDQRSLDAIAKQLQYGWPWPRELWGHITTYLQAAGAKAIVFDVLFTEPSVYNTKMPDDPTFADAIAESKSPVVFGSMVSDAGKWGPFAPPVQSPVFGAVNVGDDKTFRRYPPNVYGTPSLARAAVQASRSELRLSGDEPFLLHYYGPHQTKDGTRTFPYISAGMVLAAQIQGSEAARAAGLTPEMFKDKIVIIGAITTGTYDLKSTPLSAEYPGVEVQATAIMNMLRGQRVRPISAAWLWIATLLGAAFATIIIAVPRRATVKLLGPIVTVGTVLGVGIVLFRGDEIRWLPPVSPLIAIGIASLGAFSWVYFAEDRQRRFMLKALSKVVSPKVANELAREPERLTLGTIRRDLTILFTDLANFTGESEGMEEEDLTRMLNRYLSEMSEEVFGIDGTLDKYIGDAIMCFWNMPLPQPDHAIRACRAALAMTECERRIEDELKTYGISRVFTRIGINTARVAVGFIGSEHLFNYTAIGDGVNLASRLEGANKLYGTRIIVSETTAAQVRGRFLLRKIDVLRVKGKKKPMAVYELMAEKGKGGQLDALAEQYERALSLYQSRRWDEAERLLLELADRFADDGPTRAMLRRLEHMRESPPPADWDGVYVAKEK